MVVAHKAGISSDVIKKNFYRIKEIPFDSNRKCMSVICTNKKVKK
jgi:Ca2+-transporting ATPase